MAGIITLVVIAHLGIAAVDLPGLWAQQEGRRTFRAVVVLLLIGLAVALATVLEWLPISAFKLIEWLVEPIGRPLFRADGG